MEESELIDGYVKGELDGKSLDSVEARMITDPSFKSNVALRKLLIDSIHAAYGDELKEKLKDLDWKMDRKKIKSRYMIAASLAFVVVVSLGTYLFLNNKIFKFDSYDIYENGIPNQMGVVDNHQLTDVMNAFKSRDYSEALQLFTSMAQTDTVLYYSGISAYRIGDLNKAVSCFKNIEQGSVYYVRANYRLGLALWRQNKIDQAIPVLMNVTKDSSSEYSIKARKLLIEVP